MLYHQKIDSPVGYLNIVADNTNLLALVPEVNWNRYAKKFPKAKNITNSILENTTLQLNEYFAKKRRIFDLPLSPEGTEFQQLAWKTLLDIPYGKTICYKEQARRAGRQNAIRAIGGANGANPIAIIIPCHRVIGKSGKLTGYASGIKIKKYLLKLEGKD